MVFFQKFKQLIYNYENINDNSSQHRSADYWAGDTLKFPSLWCLLVLYDFFVSFIYFGVYSDVH